MEKIKNNSSTPKPEEPKDKVRKVMIVVGVGRIAMKKPDTKSPSQSQHPGSADCQQWAGLPSYSLTVAQ